MHLVTEAGLQISGHLDLADRIGTEVFLPYLTGTKKLQPRSGDLTFYNWTKGRARFCSSPNWEVVIDSPQIQLRHSLSGHNVVLSPDIKDGQVVLPEWVEVHTK